MDVPGNLSFTAETISRISCGIVPPFVSHNTRQEAPPSCAAASVCTAYAGFFLYPSKNAQHRRSLPGFCEATYCTVLPNHPQILIQGGAYDIRHMKIPTLSENRYYRRLRRQQRIHVGVLLRCASLMTSAAECYQFACSNGKLRARSKNSRSLGFEVGLPAST